MPLFEFICKTCNKKFEKLILSDEDKNIVCPACGADKVEKQFSSFAAKSSASACSPSMPAGCPGKQSGCCGCR
jgi:putative FmdB family regulatory protein